MKRCVVLIASLVLVLSTPSSANMSAARDPDDTRGPLDMKRISHGHASNKVLWHKLVMRHRWGAKDLRDNGEIRFYFSNDREDRYDEVHVSVGLKDGKLAAWIFSYVEGSDYASVGPSERIRLVRPDRFSIKIFFRKTWMRNRTGRYTWSVGSDYHNRDSTNCRRGCFDYAPGRNPDRLQHRLS